MNKALSHFVITVFMCGDVMTGRGIDQVLPYPSVPHIFEPYVRDARRYVDLAEEVNGPIPKPVGFGYVWGDALDILKRMAPDVKLINLETSITTSEDYWLGKGINYRMHPGNAPSLTAAGIDISALANNHVLDWGYGGLAETLQTLKNSRIKSTGAGQDLNEATAPAVAEVKGKGRVIVFSFGSDTSGIPVNWGATGKRPGVNLLPDLSRNTVHTIAARVRDIKRPGDIVIVSIHWGGNWGYEVPGEEIEFAHHLIDDAGIDIIHGHSSHHVKGIEVYHGKPVIYGCGDFINDYEGIGGHERYRGELSLMYFVQMDPSSGRMTGLIMKPTRMKNFRVNRASREEAQWLATTLNREGKGLSTCVEMEEDSTLVLKWKSR